MGLAIVTILNFIDLITSKTIWILSLGFGIFLSIIGYPKEVVVFVLALCLIDIASKHLSIVVSNYQVFTIKTYLKAWKEKKLTSRAMKNGTGVKVMLYTPILYIANQLTLGNLSESILFANQIGNILYTLLGFIEFSSILENFVDSGHDELLPFLNFLRKKEKEYIEEVTLEDGTKEQKEQPVAEKKE